MKNTFLHGDPEEKIYMEVPLDLTLQVDKDVVCRLLKTLYRLK